MKSYDATEVDYLVGGDKIKDLITLNPYRHAYAIVFDWAIIFLMMYAWVQYHNWLSYPLIVIVIAGRMHGLAVLMHDATHYRFLKNKTANDIITNITTMYPLLMTIEDYRRAHLAHHTRLNTEEDPDWKAKLGNQDFMFPKTKEQICRNIGLYLIGYKGVLDILWMFRRLGFENKAYGRLVFLLVLFALITSLDLWEEYFLLWLVPYFVFFTLFLYVRSVAEHFGGLRYDTLLSSTRTVKANMYERIFLAPHNVNYHLEHHLYPAVPFYNLPNLHKRLMEIEKYRNEAHITVGYFKGLVSELITLN